MTAIIKVPPSSNAFTYDLDFLAKGAELYEMLGRMPTYKEILDYDISLHNQILLYIEGQEWGGTVVTEGD